MKKQKTWVEEVGISRKKYDKAFSIWDDLGLRLMNAYKGNNSEGDINNRPELYKLMFNSFDKEELALFATMFMENSVEDSLKRSFLNKMMKDGVNLNEKQKCQDESCTAHTMH